MSSQQNLGRIRGFSLLEILIVLAIFSFIVGGIFTTLDQSQVRYQFEQEVAEVQQSARNAIDIMEREIRLAGFPKASYYSSTQNWTGANSNRVAQGFITIAASNLVFEADIEEDGIVERVDYNFANGTLSRSAADKLAGGGAPASDYKVLAENVTALTFTYRDADHAATAAVAQVRSVGISISMRTPNVDPASRQPRTITAQSEASVRN